MKGFRPTGFGPSAGFKFPASFGFTGSTGAYTNVLPYIRQKPRAFKDGGYVSEMAGDPGHALVQRNRPYTNEDQESGGKTPLRRGFKKGGKVPGPPGMKHNPNPMKAKGPPSDAMKRSRVMKKAAGGAVRGGLSSMVGKAKQQQMMKPAPKIKPMPAMGMKGKFAAADGGSVPRRTKDYSMAEGMAAIPKYIAEKIGMIKDKMAGGQRTVEGRNESIDDRVTRDTSGKTTASNYARGGRAMKRGAMSKC